MTDYVETKLLAVILTDEDTFWFCEPRVPKALPEDWKAVECRWLYPVEHNVSRFAEESGFDSTDAVYEVETSATSKVLRAATLAWNIPAKRQRIGKVVYVFVPAEEVKRLEEGFKRFVKLEAGVPALPPRELSAGGIPASNVAPVSSGEVKTEPIAEEATSTANDESLSCAAPTPTTLKPEAIAEEHAEELTGGDGNPSDNDTPASSKGKPSRPPRTRASDRRRRLPSASLLSHKRREPHRGTTTYTAPVRSTAFGDHRSNEAFDWPDHYIVHRGSIDYLCPKRTENTYGFRLDRVMHCGFPVFMLFGSRRNNSEEISPSAQGVQVHQKSVLTGEGGEGIGNSVMVMTRLSSKKRQLRYANSDSDEEDEAENSEEDDDDQDDEWEDDAFDSSEEEDDEDDDDDDGDERRRRRRRVRTRATARSTAAATSPPKTLTAVSAASSSSTALSKRAAKCVRTEKAGSKKKTEPLQSVSVNFWTDPTVAVQSASELAKEYPFRSDDASARGPQTVVLSNGACVTYSSATASKLMQSNTKKKSGGGGGGASTEDFDLSALNEHILNAFAQVKGDGGS